MMLEWVSTLSYDGLFLFAPNDDMVLFGVELHGDFVHLVESVPRLFRHREIDLLRVILIFALT